MMFPLPPANPSDACRHFPSTLPVLENLQTLASTQDFGNREDKFWFLDILYILPVVCMKECFEAVLERAALLKLQYTKCTLE